MTWEDWSDPYLPAAGHGWANMTDPYRICDVCWAIPFFPLPRPPSDPPTPPQIGSFLWVVERFTPWHYPWAEGFSWRLKNWAFQKRPYFWRILAAKLADDPNKFDFISSEEQLNLNLSGDGVVYISYLQRIDTAEITNFANYFLDFDSSGKIDALPTQKQIYPDITCDADFRYHLANHQEIIYLQKKVIKLTISGEKSINLKKEKESEDSVTGDIVPGSVVVSSPTPALQEQAEVKLGYYLHTKLSSILAEIDEYVPQVEIENVFAANFLQLSEIGHIYNGQNINALLEEEGGDPWLFFRWALVFSIGQLYSANDEDYLPLIPYGRSHAARGAGEHEYICLHLQFNSGTRQSWHSSDEEKLAQLLIKPESLNNGMLETLFHSIPGKVQGTGVINGATYVWTRWSEYPNYDLEGFLEVRADIDPFFFIERIDSLRKLINIIPPGGVFNIRSIALAEAFNIDEFFAFRGGAPDIIVDPIYHYDDPDWMNHPCNPSNQTKCYAKTPNAATSSEQLDWEKIKTQYPDLAPLMQSAFAVAGDIDIPRIYYPAINDLWNAQEEPISDDNPPYRIEFIRRYSTGWILHHDGPPFAGKEVNLDVPNQSQWFKYNADSYWDDTQNKYVSKYDFFALPFNQNNLESFFYRRWAIAIFWQSAFDQGIINYETLFSESKKRKLGMPIDSPRVIEIHWALSAQKFSYLDEDSQSPDRIATLGYYIERIARVLGISDNPDGSIRSIRQKAVIERGEPIPEGWNFGQWGENEGNATPSTLVYNQPQQGGGVGTRRDGIVYENRCNQFQTDPFSGQKTAIKQGDFVLCENWPQYIDQMLDDLDQAIDWQELGAFAIPGADNTDKTLFTEGLCQMVAELLYMASAISRNTSQTQVSSLITQGVALEVLRAFGVPLIHKSLAVDIGEEQPAGLPYPGLREDAPTLREQIGWILQNLGFINSAIVKPYSEPEAEG